MNRWCGIFVVLVLLTPSIGNALDSDGNGIPDEIEASTGGDPFSKYAVSASRDHTCALDDTGVVCWGSNFNGETTVI